MAEQEGGQGPNPGGGSPLGDGMTLAWYFPIAILLGGAFGRWVGGFFGRQGLGLGIGIVWGVAAAFYEIFKVYRRLSKGGP